MKEVKLRMSEQEKYEIIKELVDHKLITQRSILDKKLN